MKKMWSFLFALCFLLMVHSREASGVDISSIEMHQNSDDQKNKTDEVQTTQRKILNGLIEINKKIRKSVEARGMYSRQRSIIDLEIKSISRNVVELDKKAIGQRALLAERLRAIYKLGSPSVARYIFSAKNSSTLDRNLKILGIVAERDFELIKRFSFDIKDLELRKKQLALKFENLKTVEVKMETQEKFLLSEQNTKSKLLETVRRSDLFSDKKVAILKETSDNVELEDSGIFDLILKPAFFEQKGNLPMPVQGTVVSKFGPVKGKDHPYVLLNKGIHIVSDDGSPIKSVFPGTISFVGNIPGMGASLIVDHGDHYYSVYGNAHSLDLNVGDQVHQNQIIAKMGRRIPFAMDSEKNRPESELYFEIRHFSEPNDPLVWMKGL